MLISFSVGNFLSFKDVQTLSLVPESLKELEGNLHFAYHYSLDEKLLKSMAIYGHNSFGKTNFLKAFQFLQSFIFNSFSTGQIQKKINVTPFRLNTSMVDKPSSFEIYFLIKETKYRYRIRLNSEFIVEESLHYAEAKVRENFLFERQGQEIKVSKNWNKDSGNRTQQAIAFTQPHILFLSVLLSQSNIPRIVQISNWLSASIVIPDNYLLEFNKARHIYSNLDYRNLILKFIDNADLGFKTIFDKVDSIIKSRNDLGRDFLDTLFEKEISNFEIFTQHSVYNESRQKVGTIEFELQKNESAGSIKYFIIVCLLSYAIKNSQLIWIDELDSKFDSNLLEMLVNSFHNPEINPINSQLIFTTHNTIFLDRKLRRDQMIVVEKNDFGESTLRRAHSAKKPIRIGKSMEKEYRKGELGGISKKVKNSNTDPTLFD